MTTILYQIQNAEGIRDPTGYLFHIWGSERPYNAKKKKKKKKKRTKKKKTNGHKKNI
jgi:hypothetical protein